jgi:hypothetical protein
VVRDHLALLVDGEAPQLLPNRRCMSEVNLGGVGEGLSSIGCILVSSRAISARIEMGAIAWW